MNITMLVKCWTDKKYGNTYHAVRVLKNGAEVACSDEMSYGRDHTTSTVKLMVDAGLLSNDLVGLSLRHIAEKTDIKFYTHVAEVPNKKSLLL